MPYNHFKAIRSSFFTSTILTCILSNILVFGQPIQQMSQRIDRLEVPEGSPSVSLNNSLDTEAGDRSPEHSSTRATAPDTKNNTPLIFDAIEKEGFIGVPSDVAKENPRDNFFTVDIPQAQNLEAYDAILKYDLFGLKAGSQTTKSINGHKVYGGQVIEPNESWTSVEEYIPAKLLNVGRNEIFFNRKADENYLYRIKDLSIELVGKRSGNISITSESLINYNGNLHIVGYVNDNLKEVKALGETIPVKDGVFESVLKNVPSDLKTLKVTYGEANDSELYFEVVYKKSTESLIFQNSNEDHNQVSHEEAIGMLSLDALKLEKVSDDPLQVKESVTVQGLNFDELKPVNPDVVNVTSGKFLGYRVNRLKMSDSSIVKLHLQYDETKFPDGYSDKDVRTFMFDRFKREWVALPVDSLDHRNRTVISYFNGDTDYINGIIKVPEMAETSSFAPTTITDMEYADPASGVVGIAPPSPNTTGNASTGFPIKVPPGRNGLAPNLSVNYSSEGGNGWMGLGWNLQIPAMTLDTRWGVPRFDATNETEIYQLNGEPLVLEVNGEYTSPHRYDGDIARNTSGTKTFYMRKEGQYLKIVRYGNSPQNYRWLVWDKFGNRNLYGGNINGVDENCVVRDGNNNITHWALRQTVDPHGNYILYYYSKGGITDYDGDGTDDGIPAQYFYPTWVRYTLNGSTTPNYYQVNFIRNTYNTATVGSGSTVAREDINLNARTGTLMVTKDVLTEIRVRYYDGQWNQIRSYRFDYEESAFRKTQLGRISEYDAAGNLFYSNTMEYYDEIGNGTLINGTGVNWDGTPYTISSPLEDMATSGFSSLLPEGSALGTSTSSGFSAGLRVGVGIGYNPTSVSVTLGGSYNYSQSKEKDRINFVDINGDGLPDKVYNNNSGSTVSYLPNLGVDNNTGSFGYPTTINGLNRLSETKSRTNGFGFDANAVIIGVGASRSRTRTDTDHYFTDFNGDGLLDMANGGTVKFNTTDPDGPMAPTFDNDVDNTPNPIIASAVSQDLLNGIELETMDELRDEHPQFDHVKVWKAPYDGTVKVTGDATLLAKNDCDYTVNDNVFRLTVEKATDGQSSGTTQELPNSSSDVTFTTVGQSNTYNITGISVGKGDLLFFRTHNEVYGCGGEVQWNPVVTYTSVANIDNIPNEHNESLRAFDAGQDFMMNNGGNWSPSNGDTSVSIDFNVNSTTFSANQFSDDIRFVAEKIDYTYDSNGDLVGDPVVSTWVREYLADGGFNGSDSVSGISVNPTAGGNTHVYTFRFYALSDSNVEWDQIDWQPQITGNGSGAQYPGIGFIPYEDNINQSKYWYYGSSLPTPTIDPGDPDDPESNMLLISHDMFTPEKYKYFIEPFSSGDFPIKINWVTKVRIGSSTERILKETFYLHREDCHDPIIGSDYCDYTFRISDSPSSTIISTSNPLHEHFFKNPLTKEEVQDIKNGSGFIYSAFYIENAKFGKNGNNTHIKLELHPDQTGNYTFTTQTLTQPFMAPSSAFFGYYFRGWGQFLYNGGIQFDYDQEGNITNPTSPQEFDGSIDMGVFDIDTDPNDIENEIDNADPDDIESALNGMSVRYTFYSQDNENRQYYNGSIFNNTDTVIRYGLNGSSQLTATLGRFAEHNLHDLYVDPSDLLSGSVFAALKQRSISKGKAKSGNVGYNGNGITGTVSEATSKVLNQYLDLNGDRYPDLVTENKIQFTNMLGGLKNDAPTDTTYILDNSFVSGGSSEDATEGVNIAGMFPNSTKSDNNKGTNSTRTNIDAGISDGEGSSFNSRQWMDMNGDGLADKVELTGSEVRVQLNTGYGFATEMVWGDGYSDLKVSTRESTGIGGSIGNASYAIGFGAGDSTADLNAGLMDVNGDGLPDLVMKNGSVFKFYLNTGVGFEDSAVQTFYSGDSVDQDYSFTGNLFGSYTYGFTINIYFISIKIAFTGTAGGNAGINEKPITVQDMDGDGLADVLFQGNDNGDVTAHLNKVGKTHLLKTVNLPMGGSWTVDYERLGNTYDLPQSKWALNTITTYDGFTADSAFGPNTTLSTATYDSPKYDRREREFLGFGQVRVDQKDPSTQATYRYSVTQYHNDNIYLSGLEKLTALYDASDTILSESSTLFNIMAPISPQVTYTGESQQYLQTGVDPALLDYSRLFVAPVRTVSTTYENGEGLSVEQQFTAYDSQGNLLTYKNLGDTYTSASASDAYRTEMEYYGSIPGITNGIGFVKKVSVLRQSDGQLMRQREAEYTLGLLSKVKTKLNDTETNEVTFTYDSYGNLLTSTLDNGFATTIAYDTQLFTYPVTVSNSFGETSSSTYEYLFGVPQLVTDTNGQQMRTRLDTRGRIVEVVAPNEMPNGWTIRMQYEGESATPTLSGNYYQASGSFQAINPGDSQPTSAKHSAVTRHNVAQAQGNQLLTISLVDGMGKAIQLKKTLFANTNSSNQVRWLISGKELKDAFGRVLEARLPTVQTGYPTDPNSIPSSAFDYVTAQNTILPTVMAYDSRDRMLSVKQPGESQTAITEYGIAEGMFLTTITNELGQTFETYTDVRGRQRKSIQNGELVTQFHYNAVGEKIRVKNQQGYETFYKYDLAGRRIEERHPDHGIQTFKYDAVGNLIERSTSNLLVDGQQPIGYVYDFNRLVQVNYPQNPENNITYTYGEVGNSDAEARNAVGRLYMQEDASGVQGFGYDRLGNLNRHLRGVAVAGRHTFWYHTQWIYDSFNRVTRITYPDDETVDYNYNLGGTLNSVTRTIPDVVADDPIVSGIKYNDLGEREEITYGNGTSTSYTYDNRRRLKDLSQQFSGFGIAKRYSYDVLGNITQIETQNPQNSIPGTGQLGGPVSHTYDYDDYNRLVHAEGRYTGPNDLTTPLLAQEYSLDMEYDLAHNIIGKTQTHIQGAVATYSDPITAPETMARTNYHLDYGEYATGVYVVQGQGSEFGYVQPHAPREIIETPDGTATTNDPNYKKKLIDYDANGNQTIIKQVVTEESQAPAYEGVVEEDVITLQRNLWDEEDRLRAVDLNPDDPSAHPVAVYTYDASGQRAVRYVPGRLDVRSNANNVSKNGRDEVMIYPSPLVTSKALSKPGVAPQPDDLVSSYTKHYYIGAERINSTLGTVRDLGLYPPNIEGMFPGIRNLANQSTQEANTGLLETYTDLGQTISLNSPVPEGDIVRFVHDRDFYDAYWYHSDHLGSSSYISNTNGMVSQHMEYLPFGELLMDEHLNSYNTPYKFNGKELDGETGNYYYGARYYNPKWSLWLSVDPLADADKNVGISPYSAMANNPITYIDPDGRCWQKVGEEYVPCDEADVGATTTGAFGYNWTMTENDGWQLTNGADPSTVNYEYNDIAATGEASYYVDRYKNHIEKYNTRPPDYYLGYGHKYINRFKNETREKLSELGKEWLDETAVELQVRMNEGINASPSLQGDNAAFQKFAYETHVPAYSGSGKIGQLKVPDLWHIMWTPDWSDSFGNPDGRSQIMQMFPHVLQGPHYPKGYWDPQKNPGILKPWEPKF